MRCYLDDVEPKLLTIEDDCTVSYGVFFACHGEKQPHTPITLKRGSYIGMRANIVSGKNGVTIGENTIVGACSLVTKSLPANVTAAGVPCKVICEGGRNK